MKMKSMAMLAASGLAASFAFAAAPTMDATASDSNAQALQMLSENAPMSPEGKNSPTQNMLPQANPAEPSAMPNIMPTQDDSGSNSGSNGDDGGPDTATGDDDY